LLSDKSLTFHKVKFFTEFNFSQSLIFHRVKFANVTMSDNLHNEQNSELNNYQKGVGITHKSNPKSRDAERVRSVIKRSSGLMVKVQEENLSKKIDITDTAEQSSVSIKSEENQNINENINQNINENNFVTTTAEEVELNKNSVQSSSSAIKQEDIQKHITEEKPTTTIFITKPQTHSKPIEIKSINNSEPSDYNSNQRKTVQEKVGNMPKKRNPIFTAAMVLLGLTTGLAIYVIGNEQIAKYFPQQAENIDSVIGNNVLTQAADSFMTESSVDFSANDDSSTIEVSNDEYKIPYPNNKGTDNQTERNLNEKNLNEKKQTEQNDIAPTTNNQFENSQTLQSGSVPDIRGNNEFNSALNSPRTWKEPKSKIPTAAEAKKVEELKNSTKNLSKATPQKEAKLKQELALKNDKQGALERTVKDIPNEKTKTKKNNLDLALSTADKHKSSLQKAALNKEASKTKYIVQVQSTNDQAEAKKIAQQLKAKGIKGVSVMPSDVNGKRTYRVRFGTNGSVKQAQQDAEKAGYKKSWIIPSK